MAYEMDVAMTCKGSLVRVQQEAPFSLKKKSEFIKGKIMDYLSTVLGTLFSFGFTTFCVKKGDDWGAGSLAVWLVGMVFLGSVSGTVGGLKRSKRRQILA